MKKLILVFLFLFLNISSYFNKKPLTIMLDPAGNAQYAGRQLDDCYERGITLQFCQELKKEIEKLNLKTRVILTRAPGEKTTEALQNANFSNRLNADFFLSVHFYNENEITPKIGIYYFDKQEPFFISNNKNNLEFIPYEKAYLKNLDQTKKYATLFKNKLEELTKLNILKPIGNNFKSLIGLNTPAILIECGLKNSQDYKKLIDPIKQILKIIIDENR